MNIYLHIEIATRELDAKLLLATLAAARGHQVIISDLGGIMRGVENGSLKPGIFHTKSLTASDIKIKRHKKFIDNGFKITSLDEEAGIINHSYEGFAIDRYSEKSIEQSSAVFGYGQDDVETLQRLYPSQATKIFKTGSPRADLWKPFFSEYWGVPSSKPTRPYLLVASNCENTPEPFYERFRTYKKDGYFKRNKNAFKKLFGMKAEGIQKTGAFIEAIQHLSKFNNGYDIVLRPHPSENIEAWKTFLKDIPNVHVIREESITPWVNNAFAVMHNGCTTAIEAIVSRKPVITYIPFEVKYDGKIPNELGYNIKSKEELSAKVNNIFEEMKSKNFKNEEEAISKTILKKIYFDNNQLGAEKIVDIWENIASENFSSSSNWRKFELQFKFVNIKKKVGDILRKFTGSKMDYRKFPPLATDDVYDRVIKLQRLLKIDKKLECKQFSERVILIKEFNT